ncbi:unnamed protein product [Caenorhabditis angaria]|uniref:Amino acid transporter transmembrane domain-containing protein n=1 Tax=Caenorhabditis angaria TaxID=860376 RepID=A0A9P1N4W9_9PELO|nr:unnamed protein product [Caenorhabditis angaria]
MKLEDQGYSWWIAVIFVFGETAGSGLVALPNAILKLGLIPGSISLIFMCLIPLYTAILLGKNWLEMKSRWPEYSSHCRNPYPEMALKSIGPKMGFFTSSALNISTFGGGAVFSLLAAKTLAGVFGTSICWMLGLVGLILWPCVMLKSPMHFWQVSIVAAGSTLTAVILVLFGYFQDFETCQKESEYPGFDVSSFSSSIATILFAFGGHPCLPTIIHDMKNAEEYKKTFLISYLGLFLIYTPVSIIGYITYGDSLSDSIISSIQTDILRQSISILIAAHVFFSILIIVNPLLQASEQLFDVKQEFGIGRFLIRSVVFWTIIIIAGIVPNFGIFVSLVGGGTFSLLVLILPPLFSIGFETNFELLRLKKLPKLRLIFEILIIILGIWIMINSTWHSHSGVHQHQ